MTPPDRTGRQGLHGHLARCMRCGHIQLVTTRAGIVCARCGDLNLDDLLFDPPAHEAPH